MPSRLSIPSSPNFGQKYLSTSHPCTSLFPLLYPPFPHNYIICSEGLYESDQLPKGARDLAALLASKVYYYLGEYDEALSFALGAGSTFEAEARDYSSGEYVETVICTSLLLLHTGAPTNTHWYPAKAIDRYISQRSEEAIGTKIDPRLQSIIESIFQRCTDGGEYRQVHFILTPNPSAAPHRLTFRRSASRSSLVASM